MKEKAKKIKELLIYFNFLLKNINFFNKKKFFIFDVPMYANLGDQAIICAEKKFLKENFKNVKVIEVSSYMLDNDCIFNHIRKIVKDDDLLFLQGGGSMDDRAYNVVKRFIKVVLNFSNNKIIMFPQTIDFSNSDFGRELLKETQQVFKNNKNLILFSREEESFQRMKKYYKNTCCYLIPDIVLYLDKTKGSGNKRNDILVIMRNDMEKSMSKSWESKLNIFLSQTNFNIKRKDTVFYDKNGNKKKLYSFNRVFYLNKFWNDCRRSKLIITDRLHGMIFSTITATPAIVFSNSNHKVKGVYQWLKNNKYIVFIDDIEELNDKYEEVLTKKDNRYNCLKDDFDILKKVINDSID